MIFGSNTKEETTCLVFDIGSNSVTGSWVRYTSGRRPVILCTRHVSIDIYKDITIEHLLFAVKNALREVLALLVPQSPCAPDNIYVFVASPWYTAQSRTLFYAKRHPFIFTKQFADDLVMREFEKLHEQSHKEWKKLGDGHVPLEHKTMHVRLNGYTYSDPIGKQAERAELVSFLSMMHQQARDELERIIHSSFHVDVEFHSAVFASYYGLSHVDDIPRDYVVCDIRGEVTDIAVIRDGYIQEVISLPFGDHTIVRNFAQQLDMRPLHVQELLSMYIDDTLEEVTKKRIHNVSAAAFEHVEQSLYKAFEHMSERGLLPKHVYVYAGLAYRSWYRTLLQDNRLAPFTVSGRSFTAHDATDVMKGFVTDEEVNLDPFIVAETFFISQQL